MYAWWGILATYTAVKLPHPPLEFALPTWVFAVTLLAAMLWIVIEVTHGKKWARIALLFLLALGVRSIVHSFSLSPRYGWNSP